MFTDTELVAFGIVAEEEIRLGIGPRGRGFVDVAAELPREPTAVADARHGKVEPYRAPDSSDRRLRDDDRIGNALRDLMHDQLEAVALEPA